MIWFLLKRLGWKVLTLWVVFTTSIFMMRAVPGGPFDSEKKLPAAIKRNIEKRYQMDRPLIEQYWSHLWATMRCDFGPSYKLEDYTVNDVIAQGFPVSASLGILGELRQIILPALCLGAPFAGYISRLTRTGMLEVLGLDYIRTAYAKGLTTREVVIRHALRGAILPVVSYLGPATAGILTGSLVLEQIFALPGMGSHFIEAATQRDYTLAMGMVMVYTFLLFVMNTLVDLSYSMIDPRVEVD